jgi:hypothetical protein
MLGAGGARVEEGSGSERPALLPVRTASADDQALTVLAHQLTQAIFGAAALASEVVLRSLAESMPARIGSGPATFVRAHDAVDVLLGLGWRAAYVTDRVVGVGVAAAAPVVRFTLSPPLVPRRLTLGDMLRRAGTSWDGERSRAVQSLSDLSATFTPAASDVAVRLVDVDKLVSKVLAEVNVQRLAEGLLAQLDMNELIADLVTQIDVRRLAEQMLTDVDLTPVVEQVIEQVELDTIVDSALDELDLTDVVVERVDLQRVIDSALDRMDLTELILQRVDLVRVSEFVVNGIDLPELIRDSTGSMAAETVNEIRLQGIDADRAVARIVGRILRRTPEQP